MSSWTPRLIGRSFSFVSILPSASQISSTDPKLLAGTSYENGLTMRVTRTYLPSGDASSDRIIAGGPIFRAVRVCTSMSAS